jgi:hypothetical protein
MTFHSGIGGAAVFTPAGATNVVELAITAWNFDPKVDMVSFKNSKTGKYAKKEATYHDADGSMTFDFDFDANPFATPTSLNEGDNITNVKLFLGPTGTNSTSFWLIPSAIVVGTPQTLEVDGKIGTVCNFTADGAWTPPV